MQLSKKIVTLADSVIMLCDKVEEMEALLKESAELFRFYETSHRQRGPEHLEKAERNAVMAGRIERALGA